jgi:hypothetical protein
MVDYGSVGTIAAAAPLAFAGEAVSLHDNYACHVVDRAREVRMRPHGIAGPELS